MVYSQAERVIILEYYFTPKSLADFREAYSSAYPDKEVPNKTTIHRLATTFWDICLWSKKTAEITAVPIQSSASAATVGYGCKNSILPLVSSFCARRGSCVIVRVAF
jgi:hypothetical protein